MPAPRTYRTAGHRAVPVRAGRGGPGAHPADAPRRQDQGHRQGRPAARQPHRRRGRAVRGAAAAARPGPDLRRHHPGPGRGGLAAAARPAAVDGDRVVPRGAGRACRRGASRGISGVRPAAPRVPAARRRHGARPRRALVRVRPGRCPGRPAGGGALRRVRPRAGRDRGVPLGARHGRPACATAIPGRPWR